MRAPKSLTSPKRLALRPSRQCQGAVRSLSLATDNTVLLSGTASGAVTLWDLTNDGAALRTVKCGGMVYAVALSEDKTLLVTGVRRSAPLQPYSSAAVYGLIGGAASSTILGRYSRVVLLHSSRRWGPVDSSSAAHGTHTRRRAPP